MSSICVRRNDPSAILPLFSAVLGNFRPILAIFPHYSLLPPALAKGQATQGLLDALHYF
jgi:hypothetical protein